MEKQLLQQQVGEEEEEWRLIGHAQGERNEAAEVPTLTCIGNISNDDVRQLANKEAHELLKGTENLHFGMKWPVAECKPYVAAHFLVICSMDVVVMATVALLPGEWPLTAQVLVVVLVMFPTFAINFYVEAKLVTLLAIPLAQELKVFKTLGQAWSFSVWFAQGMTMSLVNMFSSWQYSVIVGRSSRMDHFDVAKTVTILLWFGPFLKMAYAYIMYWPYAEKKDDKGHTLYCNVWGNTINRVELMHMLCIFSGICTIGNTMISYREARICTLARIVKKKPGEWLYLLGDMHQALTAMFTTFSLSVLPNLVKAVWQVYLVSQITTHFFSDVISTFSNLIVLAPIAITVYQLENTFRDHVKPLADVKGDIVKDHADDQQGHSVGKTMVWFRLWYAVLAIVYLLAFVCFLGIVAFHYA